MPDFQISNLGPLDNYSEEMVTKKLSEIVSYLMKLQAAKGQNYGGSWQKYGEAISVFGNVARKFHRLENLVLHGKKGSPDETKIDTIADLAVYSLLWLAYSSIQERASFDEWLKRNGLLPG